MQGTLFHDLHELMVCGEVAGLFEKDEKEGITSQLAEELTQDHTATCSLWDKFVQVHAQNYAEPSCSKCCIGFSIILHWAMIFSYTGVIMSVQVSPWIRTDLIMSAWDELRIDVHTYTYWSTMIPS